jgi:hypothetical protein
MNSARQLQRSGISGQNLPQIHSTMDLLSRRPNTDFLLSR